MVPYNILQMTHLCCTDVRLKERDGERVKERERESGGGTYPGGQTLSWQKEKSWQVRWLRLCLIKLHTSLREESWDMGLTTEREREEMNCGWAARRMESSYGKQSFQMNNATFSIFLLSCLCDSERLYHNTVPFTYHDIIWQTYFKNISKNKLTKPTKYYILNNNNKNTSNTISIIFGCYPDGECVWFIIVWSIYTFLYIFKTIFVWFYFY